MARPGDSRAGCSHLRRRCCRCRVCWLKRETKVGMSSSKRHETYLGPTGWARWGIAGGIPWLLSNFAAIGWMFGSSARADLALGVGSLCLLGGLALSFLLGRVRTTSSQAWKVAAGAGALDGASFGPALYYLGNDVWASVVAGGVLAVLGAGALGGMQFAWINQGMRDRPRERRRSKREE